MTPETRLGPYQIVGLLGAGGMGEVYRATDTSLGRQVAQGPIALDEVLSIARQMAEALETAHDQAIVHRDRQSFIVT